LDAGARSSDQELGLCEEEKTMTDIPKQLRTIRDHLHTGALGQREAWEKWLDEAIDELDQLFWSKNALQVEIDRLRALNDDQHAEMLSWHMQLTAKDEEIAQLKKIQDGTERRECEYLALIESKSDAIDRLSLQWGVAKREAEKLLHERNDEIARLRGSNTKLESENERLKAERRTTKRMLKDILDKHGYSGWDAARTME
jgi:chromosome segregation ATPase